MFYKFDGTMDHALEAYSLTSCCLPSYCLLRRGSWLLPLSPLGTPNLSSTGAFLPRQMPECCHRVNTTFQYRRGGMLVAVPSLGWQNHGQKSHLYEDQDSLPSTSQVTRGPGMESRYPWGSLLPRVLEHWVCGKGTCLPQIL